MRRVRTPVVVGGGALFAAAALAVRSPYSAGSYGFCPIRAVTGLWCPGCGGLRAVHDLMYLDLTAAWDMNALAVLAVPVLVAMWVRWVWLSWRGRPTQVMGLRGALVLAAVLVSFTVARNIPPLVPLLAP